MTNLVILGPFQILLIIGIPVGIFFLGYSIGKKAGYIKRVKETEKKITKKDTDE